MGVNLVIGLTGGIASGKSTAAKLLGSWGAYVIDADKLGHKAYLAGSAAFHQVVATFGEDVVGSDGEIDRAKLGAKVFGPEQRLDELTAIVWPAIHDMAAEEIAEHQDQIVVLEAAVLIEAEWQDLVDELWVVVVDIETAIARATERDGLSREAVEERIAAQLSNDERKAHAHRVIDNSEDLAAMEAQLNEFWQELKQERSE